MNCKACSTVAKAVKDIPNVTTKKQLRQLRLAMTDDFSDIWAATFPKKDADSDILFCVEFACTKDDNINKWSKTIIKIFSLSIKKTGELVFKISCPTLKDQQCYNYEKVTSSTRPAVCLTPFKKLLLNDPVII